MYQGSPSSLPTVPSSGSPASPKPSAVKRTSESLAAEQRARKAGLLDPKYYVFKRAAEALAGTKPDTANRSLAAPAIVTPAGYSVQTVASGFDAPVKAVWAPDGRIFVAEHSGVIKVINKGVASVLVDLSPRVNSYLDRGLNTIALDPDFATNHYLYAGYTFENDASNPNSCKTARITRLTVNGNTAGSETVLMGKVSGGGSCSFDASGNPVGSACPAATTTDCIPNDHWSHAIGDIRFSSDKSMYVSFGDGASYAAVDAGRAYRAQSVDSLVGKIVRVDRFGRGVNLNPYYNGSNTANRSKVWSVGERNVFRFTLVGKVPVGGNVGWYTTEEIQRSVKGGNDGWPCYEGKGRATNGYEQTAQCKDMYAGNVAVQSPLITWEHNGNSASAVGGVVVTGSKYPAELQGAYLYGDYSQSTMSYARFDANFNLVGSPKPFISNADGPVAFEMGPDGSLYYVSIMTGELRRIDYTPSVTCDNNTWRVEYFANNALNGTPAHQTCEALISPKIDKDWDTYAPRFTPADTSFPADNFSVRSTCLCGFTAGNYTFTATADNTAKVLLDDAVLIDTTASGTATKYLSGTHKITVEYIENTGTAKLAVNWAVQGMPPKPIITAPHSGEHAQTAGTVTYKGSATDGNGSPLPASSLSWDIVLRHCYNPSDCHSHTVTKANGVTSGSFTMPQPDAPPDTDYVIVSLTAKDPATGQTATALANVYYGANACPANSWNVQFFPNTDLSSVPTHENCWGFLSGAKLDQDWGDVAPIFDPADTTFPKDFSARFSCDCDLSGATTFALSADDHAILYIDGVQRLDTRRGGTYSANLTGRHRVVVEYIDATGPARVKVNW